VELIELKRLSPRAWHTAEAGTWPRIREHGLLSTTALLDTCELTGDERRQIEEERRPHQRVIEAAALGSVVIRDQRPLQLGPLEAALVGSGMTVGDWCRELNRRVFFWLDEKRLASFLAAYSESEHDVLVVDARALADRHEQRITLSSINSGAALRRAAPRGRDTFKTIAEYPTRPSGGPAKPIVELAVEYAVPDIAELMLRVERRRGPHVVDLVWEPSRAL
jgi:hypothetical protein